MPFLPPPALMSALALLGLLGPQASTPPTDWTAPTAEALVSPGLPFCMGATGCPCGNNSPTGGCRNSTGTGASLIATGTTSVAADDLVLTTQNAPPGNTGLFVMGIGAPADQSFPLGDGLSCVGQVFRFTPGVIDGAGQMSLSNIAAKAPVGTIVPGGGRIFQAWMRDVLCGPPPTPCPSPCGTGRNVSSGCLILFTP